MAEDISFLNKYTSRGVCVGGGGGGGGGGQNSVISVLSAFSIGVSP